ncbi:MAG: sugar MFS transporter [Sphingomonas fennica]
MAMGPTGTGRVTGAAVAGAATLAPFVFALFFLFGGITSLNDVLIPKLKDLFTLTTAQAMLTQSAFFAAYFIVSFPAGLLVARIGYLRAAVVGLGLMAAGCLLFIPAAQAAAFGPFLFALFVLAAGITVVQVVANPLISLLGDPATASSRLTFAQAFNSLGTTIFPLVGASIILGSLQTVDPATLAGAALDAYRAAETQTIVRTYLVLAAAIAVVAVVVWTARNRLQAGTDEAAGFGAALGLLRRPRFAFGTLGIFLYVGAEVAIGSLIVLYLERADTLALGAEAAGQHVALYWGGAMVGRFVGAVVLRLVPPPVVLATAAGAAIALLALSANSVGVVSGYSLLGVGLFNSIMFPTIFSLASEGLGKRSAEGSGIICMAIVGGAIVPLLTGAVADGTTLRLALAVPALCYAGILGFALFARRPLAG